MNVKLIEKKAFWARLKSHQFKILLSTCIIVITIILIIFFDAIACNERIKFIIGSLWPGGVIVILVPLWTDVVRDIKENIGYEIYRLVKREITHGIVKEEIRSRFLAYLDHELGQLRSPDRIERRQALERIIQKFKEVEQTDI